MDHFEQFAATANNVVCVLGDPLSKDFLLISLGTPMETELQNDIVRRGLHFCGLLGTFNGIPRSDFAEPLDTDSVISIAQAYLACVPQVEINRLAERIYANVDPPKPNDFAEFMSRLTALEDPR